MTPSRRLILRAGLMLASLFVLFQLVPYGRAHTNPPVTGTPRWDSPRTEELARRACFDCHSNQTRWPWYSNVAPLSWRIQNHVEAGRRKFNMSQMDRRQKEADEAGEVVEKAEMPPFDYAMAHPEARLTPEERSALAQGLIATFGGEKHEAESGRGLRRGDDGSRSGR